MFLTSIEMLPFNNVPVMFLNIVLSEAKELLEEVVRILLEEGEDKDDSDVCDEERDVGDD
jgi:hypothetical protein